MPLGKPHRGPTLPPTALRRPLTQRNRGNLLKGSGMAQWLYVAVTQGPERRFEFSEG